MKNKPVSIPPWSLLPFLSPSSCLSFSGGLCPVSQTNPFPPKFWPVFFITATESKLRLYVKQYMFIPNTKPSSLILTSPIR